MSSAPTVISTQSQIKASRAANKELTGLNAKGTTPQLHIQPKFAVREIKDPLGPEIIGLRNPYNRSQMGSVMRPKESL